MRKYVLYSTVFVVVVSAFLLVISDHSLWSEEKPLSKSPGKNLQVMEFKDMIELQSYMKGLTDALGVTCKYCHDMRDFSSDVEELHKDEARAMMVLTQEYNEKLLEFYTKFTPDEEELKKKKEKKVTCFTCHRGNEHPAFSEEDVESQ